MSNPWSFRFPFSLKYSVPLLILILGSLLSGTTIYQQVNAVKRQFELDAISTGELDGKQASTLLDYIYRSETLENNNGVKLLVSQLAVKPNLLSAFLLNENSIAVAATNYRLTELPLESLPIQQDAALLDDVRNYGIGKTILTSDKQRIVAAYPVVMGGEPGDIAPSRKGIIVLEYDLATQRQTLVKSAIQRSLGQTGFLMVTCLVIWFFLEVYVTRRAERLVKTSEALATGDMKARAKLEGSDELAKISDAFDQMATQIQQDTESLQRSEAELWDKTQKLTKAFEELQHAQLQLVQSEKMSSLGQLVAGIAHEINNPVNFIYGNLSHTRNYSKDLLCLIDLYQDRKSVV